MSSLGVSSATTYQATRVMLSSVSAHHLTVITSVHPHIFSQCPQQARCYFDLPAAASSSPLPPHLAALSSQLLMLAARLQPPTPLSRITRPLHRSTMAWIPSLGSSRMRSATCQSAAWACSCCILQAKAAHDAAIAQRAQQLEAEATVRHSELTDLRKKKRQLLQCVQKHEQLSQLGSLERSRLETLDAALLSELNTRKARIQYEQVSSSRLLSAPLQSRLPSPLCYSSPSLLRISWARAFESSTGRRGRGCLSYSGRLRICQKPRNVWRPTCGRTERSGSCTQSCSCAS